MPKTKQLQISGDFKRVHKNKHYYNPRFFCHHRAYEHRLGCTKIRICMHQRIHKKCRYCNGNYVYRNKKLCEHGEIQDICIDSCRHGRICHKCIICTGKQLCDHVEPRSNCKTCIPHMCSHGNIKYYCNIDAGRNFVSFQERIYYLPTDVNRFFRHIWRTRCEHGKIFGNCNTCRKKLSPHIIESS